MYKQSPFQDFRWRTELTNSTMITKMNLSEELGTLNYVGFFSLVHAHCVHLLCWQYFNSQERGVGVPQMFRDDVKGMDQGSGGPNWVGKQRAAGSNRQRSESNRCAGEEQLLQAGWWLPEQDQEVNRGVVSPPCVWRRSQGRSKTKCVRSVKVTPSSPCWYDDTNPLPTMYCHYRKIYISLQENDYIWKNNRWWWSR